MAKKHAKKTGYTKKWKSFKNQDARKMEAGNIGQNQKREGWNLR